ncbi:MAG: class II aldolase/adducin family protein [Spirochaetaceae bacterium]|nr:MAG: class II aldolase/adducin family protein [Spirochaetaceae bacterium]
MYETEKQQVIRTALQLKEYHLIALAGGNVSLRIGSHILVTPSGMTYDSLVPDDIIVMTIDGTIVEGERKPSVDTIALLYIFEKLPEVNAIIHTHQVYATAAGLVCDVLPCAVTTLPNATLGEVNVAPYSSAASLEMGIETVKYLNGKRAVILKHHGVVTVGANLKEALYAAVYLEDAAQTFLVARSVGEVPVLNSEQIEAAVEVFRTYGQSVKDEVKQ